MPNQLKGASKSQFFMTLETPDTHILQPIAPDPRQEYPF